MDPMLLTTVLVSLLTSAASEAGKGAWQGLTSLVKRKLGNNSAAATALDEAVSNPDDASAPVMTAALEISKAAKADAEFARELQQWHYSVTQGPGSVTNIISGNATITGSVTQLHTLQGDIHQA